MDSSNMRHKEQKLNEQYQRQRDELFIREKMIEIARALGEEAVDPEDELGWLLSPLSPDQIREAVAYLQKVIPQRALFRIFVVRKRKGTVWRTWAHFGYGMRVRALLQEGGFGSFDQFDDCWGPLVEAAARHAVRSYRSVGHQQ